MQTGRETYIAVVCIGGADRTRLSVINIINWGVWLVSNFIIIIFFNFLKCSEIGSNLFFFINRGGTSVSLTDLYVFLGFYCNIDRSRQKLQCGHYLFAFRLMCAIVHMIRNFFDPLAVDAAHVRQMILANQVVLIHALRVAA